MAEHIKIDNIEPRKRYDVAGTPQSAFTIPFPFFTVEDLRVYVGDQPLALTTDYTVTGILGYESGFPGGTLNLNVPVTNTTVLIFRDIASKRMTDFPNSGPFSIKALNTELDRIVAVAQQMRARLDRTIGLADSDDESASLVLPPLAERALSYLGFDADGKPVAYTPQVINTPELGEGSVIDSKVALNAGIASSKLLFTRGTPGSVPLTVYAKLLDFISIHEFGAAGDNVANDSPAFNAWLEALQQFGCYKGYLLNGRVYRLASEPPLITRRINIEGPGVGAVEIRRDYNATSGRGVFTLTGDAGGSASSSKLSGFSVMASAGSSSGSAIAMYSTADIALTGCVLEDLWLSTYGTDNWATTLLMDGTAKATGAIGIRDTSVRNVSVFGSTNYSVIMKGVVALDWFGGGIYPAGGAGVLSGGMQMTGTSSVNTQQVTTDLASCGGLNITNTINCKIGSRIINAISGASVANAPTAQNIVVEGQPAGTVQSNWLSSGVRRPGQAFATS